MRQKFTVPRKNYIMFELVKINKVLYRKGDPGAITQEDVIYMVIYPENINYSLQSRDYIVQGSEDFFITKYTMQPEKVSINGYFGAERRLVAGTYMSGWERLSQFEETIVRKSKLLTSAEMYAVNYYDFYFQRFGAVNINSWNLSGSARSNTNMERYSLDFVILGDLLKTTTASQKDDLLNILTSIYLPNTGFFSEQLKTVENWYNSTIHGTVASVTAFYEGYSLALEEISSITRTISEGVNTVKGAIGDNLGRTVTRITQFDKVKNIYSQGKSIFR